MLFRHPAQPGRAVRLGYCMNVHPTESAADVVQGLTRVALPLRARLCEGRPFGVGMYVPARAAAELLAPAGHEQLLELRRLLRAHELVPFTYNAFPFGGFHRDGLKQQVFQPTWAEEARCAFTLEVARLAAFLAPDGLAQLSISTHAGRFGRWEEGDPERALARQNLLEVAAELAQLHAQGAPRIVLALEPEPRSAANDSAALVELLRDALGAAGSEREPRARRAEPAPAAAREHLGACLDACHLAVEFESPARALAALARERIALGKLQFSSALRVARESARGESPGELSPGARGPLDCAALLALDEPVFLHQVTGRRGAELLRVDDLGELARALAAPDSRWRELDELRCHFHVPVDLERRGGLSTTRAEADELLERALEPAAEWGSSELHLEIETYTWQLLERRPPHLPELLDGLEGEYRHVLGQLAARGWGLVAR